MAEYFETGAASDVNDLLGKVRNAMTLHGGWTQQLHQLDGASGGYRTHLSKGNLKVNFRTGFNNEVPVAVANRTQRFGNWNWAQPSWTPDYLAFNLSSDFNFSEPWNAQPGAPGYSDNRRGMALMLTVVGAISRYWLFLLENPDAVYLVVETSPDKFQYLAFGNLKLIQAVESGGEFMIGSRQVQSHYNGLHDPFASSYGSGSLSSTSTSAIAQVRGFVRLVDSRWFNPAADDTFDGWGRTYLPRCCEVGGSAFLSSWSSSAQNYRNGINTNYLSLEGRSLLDPVAAYKGLPSGSYTLLGYLPHMGRLSLEAYMAGDQVVGVGDTYLAFPGHQRAVPWSNSVYGSAPSNHLQESYNFYGIGFAIRRP